MVAPAIIGALIGAGSSLLGGLADRKQRNKELAMQDPQYIRDRYEAAGFNPLLGIGNALGGLGYAPTMGHAMSDAGSMIAQGITASEQQKIQLAELDLENRRLEQQLRLATLSPRFPGVYGRRNPVEVPDADTRGPDGRLVHPDDRTGGNLGFDSRTYSLAPNDHNLNEAALFTAFGIPFEGSGAWSNGQTFEDALGDTPFTWATAPLIVSDAIGATARREFETWRNDRRWDRLMADQRAGIDPGRPVYDPNNPNNFPVPSAAMPWEQYMLGSQPPVAPFGIPYPYLN